MAKKDTALAIAKRGVPLNIAQKLAHHFTLSELKKTTVDSICKTGISEKEALKALKALGLEPKSEKKGDEKDSILREFGKIKGIGPSKAEALYAAGFRSLDELHLQPMEAIARAKGVGKRYAQIIKNYLMPSKDEVIREFEDLKGIGKKKAELLWDSGYHSILDLKVASEQDLRRIVGTSASKIKESIGHVKVRDVLAKVETVPPPKS